MDLGSYTNYVATKGGRGGQGNVYFCLHGGRGVVVKCLRSFLDPIFSKNYIFVKVDCMIFLYSLARDPFKSTYKKKLKGKKIVLLVPTFFESWPKKI